MTQEQKAKAYDKALERARKVYNNISPENSSVKKILEKAFPELCQSEDERIRKNIKVALMSVEEELADFYSTHHTSQEEFLAWIEKQGEQKSVVIIPKFRVGDEVITENEESLTITRIDEEGYWSNDLFICGFDDSAEWKLVEQKPIEWKQENREELTEFENAMMHIGGSFFGENAGLDPNDTDTIKEQAGLLLELAPKTEWSEEDEKNLEMIIWYVEKGGKLIFAKTDKLVSWLKSLKQRHTWKPSEEQMKALDSVIDEYDGYPEFDSLVSLKNDLKKL